MAEETPGKEGEGEGTEVDESLMSAGDMIAQEIAKTSDAVQAEEGEGDGKETKEEGEETGTEGKTSDPEGEAKEEPEGTPTRGFQAFDGDKESEDYKALDGLNFKFKSNGEDVSFTAEELVREVQKKDGLVAQIKNRTRERDDTHQKLLTTEQELSKASGNGDLLLKILQDPKAYEELKAKFLDAGGSATPTAAEGEPAAKADGPTLEEQYMESGRGVVEEHILPFSKELAELYGADAKEIAQEIIGLAGESPQEYFTEETLDEIMNVKIPEMLVDAGFVLQEGKTAPTFDSNVLAGDNGNRAYGIQKKGAAPRGETEKETKLEARIKELEEKIEGKGSSTEDPKGDLDSVSGGPGETGSGSVESGDIDLNLDGADSVADIMKRVHAFGE